MEGPNIKRRYLRKDVAVPVKFEWEGESRSCLTNTVGEGGIYVQTLIPPPVGSRILLDFELEGFGSIQVTGEVRHSLENTYGSLPAGFGVQFLDLREIDRQKILQFMNAEE